MNLYKENIVQPVLFSRIGSPAVTLPFLLIALIGLAKIQQRHFKTGVALAGIFGGLLFYVYYYYQIAYIFTLILLAVVYIARKSYDRFFRMILIGIIVNIVALPWYLQYFSTRKLSPEFILHMSGGPANQSFFEIICILMFMVLLIISCLLYKPDMSADKDKPYKFFDSGYLPIYMLILVAIFAQGASYSSSFLIQSGHFLQQITNGFSLLVICCIIGRRFLLRSRAYKVFIIISICALIALLFIKQAIAWQGTKRYFQANPLERTAEEFIHRYTTHKDVIGISDPFLNSVFAVRIWRFRFYAGYFGLSNIDWQENLHRYLFMQKIFNRPWEHIDSEFSPQGTINLLPLRDITVPYLLSLRRYFTIKERQGFSKFYESLNKAFLDTKKIDYLLCLSPKDEKDLRLGAEKLGINIYLVERNSGVSLYKLENQPKK